MIWLFKAVFQQSLNISQIGNGMAAHNCIYQNPNLNLLQNIIGIDKNTWV
jgi:hypothetical protein